MCVSLVRIEKSYLSIRISFMFLGRTLEAPTSSCRLATVWRVRYRTVVESYRILLVNYEDMRFKACPSARACSYAVAGVVSAALVVAVLWLPRCPDGSNQQKAVGQ
jgi:hypothetical protein